MLILLQHKLKRIKNKLDIGRVRPIGKVPSASKTDHSSDSSSRLLRIEDTITLNNQQPGSTNSVFSLPPLSRTR
jgi:hypothetical protein